MESVLSPPPSSDRVTMCVCSTLSDLQRCGIERHGKKARKKKIELIVIDSVARDACRGRSMVFHATLVTRFTTPREASARVRGS